MIILEKIIEPGSLRWIGQNFNSLAPQDTVIAGNSIQLTSLVGICNPDLIFVDL